MRNVRVGAIGTTLTLVPLLAGCGSSTDLYPLRVGTEWTYTVKNSFGGRVQQVKVTRRIPAAFTNGYELNGPMGVSRLAWRGGTLYAEALPNTRIYKPLPMLVANDPKAHVKWAGTVETADGVQPATAELQQSSESLDFGTKKFDTIKATISMKIGQRDIELETWYARGIGPVRQDQRTNGKLDVHVDLLGGPI